MKRRKIKQSFYRALRSEMLPYELPLLINNNGYYRLADRWRLTFDGDKIIARRGGLSEEERMYCEAFLSLVNGNSSRKRSLNYFIGKGDKERELVLVHPYMQLKMLKFYRQYESLMLNFCQRSEFSLRYIDKRATIVHPQKNMPSAVEKETEYEINKIPKHYFHYRRYQNINGFYEGKEFQRLESRFHHLFKTDIKHCFDDIPIQRLSEILYQKEQKDAVECGFAGKFTAIMEEMNKGRKTYCKAGNCGSPKDGVVIGPEFSRLFAEMFLQAIDRKIENAMSEGKHPYMLHDDYECFRYVDDIFFFYNESSVFMRFYQVLKEKLSVYGMGLNTKKNESYKLPLINGKTKAKRELRLVIEKMTEDRLDTTKGLIRRMDDKYDFPLYMKSQFVIMDINTIVNANKINLKDVTSSMLAHLHRKLAKKFDDVDTLLKEYDDAALLGMMDKPGKNTLHQYENALVAYICELIKVLFYIFNNDMRMSTSIRVLTILSMAVSFCKGKLFDKDIASQGISSDAQNIIYKKILDEIHFTLRHNRLDALNGLEISNLLLIIMEMPRSCHITANDWETFLKDRFVEYSTNGVENILMAITLLPILGRNDGNSSLSLRICDWLMADAEFHEWNIDDMECFLIISTLLPAPSIPSTYKEKIINAMPEQFREAASRMTTSKTSPFAQWEDFKLTKACQMKFSAEVY